MKKPFLCKIGLHEVFKDTVGTNVGTEQNSVYFFNTYETCNRCGWSTRPNA